MSHQNVGKREAFARIMAAVLLSAAAWVGLVMYYTPGTATGAVIVWCGSALLIKSSVTRYCPVHEKAGVNTCPARADGGEPCSRNKPGRAD